MHVSNDNTASKGLRGDSLMVPRRWPGTFCERAMPAGRLGDGKQRTSRSFCIGAILVVVSLVLVGCTSGPSKTASRGTSTAESGKSSASTAVTSVPAAKFIEPPGPVSVHPALLDEASAVCRRAGASDITLCAGTVDAEVWGMPSGDREQSARSTGLPLESKRPGQRDEAGRPRLGLGGLPERRHALLDCISRPARRTSAS